MSKEALNLTDLRSGNRARILECLRYRPHSRAELCERIGLAKSSVTAITGEMLHEGLLCELGPAEKSKRVGRTRVLLDLDDRFGFAVGVHLHRRRIAVAAVGLKGRVLFEFSRRTADFSSSEEVLSYLNTYLSHGIEEAGLDRSRLLGIGIAGPGPLDPERGVILEPPNFPLFKNFPIVARLKETYGCPTFLENNAVALALYEHYAVRPLHGNALFVTVSDGVGSALLRDGEIYRGPHGFTGELGHIPVDPQGEECPCGNRGCLETCVALGAMRRRFGFSSYPSLADAASRGDRNGEEALSYLTRTLGAALVTATNLFGLDTVVLYGEYAYRADRLTASLTEYLRTHAILRHFRPVTVLPSGQEENTAAAAAAVPVLNRFFKETTAFL